MENPKIRFKGYTKDWEQRKLGDVIDDMYNGQTPSRNKSEYWNGTIKWLSSGELNRGTVYDSIETITEEGQKAANLKIVPKGTFVMAITGLEAAGTRGNCALLGFDTTLNQSCMALFPKQEMLTSEFLFQWYRKVGEEYGINYTQGTKQQSYNAELIKILPISLPSVVEQRKISSYLSHLDHLITLHQRKCEQTKKLKKYMLQKMFPQNGAKVPEIRFDGFTYDWEQRKFGELYSKVSEKNDLSFGADKIISVANMYFKEEVKESSDEYMRTYNVMRLGDIAFEGNKSKNYSHGRFVENTIGDGIVSHVFDVFRPTTSYDLLFWKYLINNEGVMGRIMARCTNASTMMTNLVASDFLKEKILVPSLKEQKKIGAYFDSLDHLITLHQRKCDELKKMKKYMLQNMFI